MIIRRLSTEDISNICSLQNKFFPDGWSKSMLESAFSLGTFYGYGVFENSTLIAFITYTVGLDSVDIEDVLTHPDHRCKGFAKKLVSLVVDDVTAKGINKILLEVRSSNENAKNLYLGFGFKQISVRKKYYSDDEDAIIMLKEL